MYRHDYSYSGYGISSSKMGKKVFYKINSGFVGGNMPHVPIKDIPENDWKSEVWDKDIAPDFNEL